VTTCTYDNPATMTRECWQDKKLICFYSWKVLQPFAKDPVPREYLFHGANIGPWKHGQMCGDASAIKQEPKTYWTNDVYPIDLVRKVDYDDLRNSLSVLVNFIEGCHWEYELPSDVSNIIQDWPKIHRLGKTKRKEKNT